MNFIPAAVITVCLTLLSSWADGFVASTPSTLLSSHPTFATPGSTSGSVRNKVVDFTRLHADTTAKARDTAASESKSTKDGDNDHDDDDAEIRSPISSTLDHEHSAAETYPAFTTTSLSNYHDLHAQSIKSPAKFWSHKAKELLSWSKPFNPHAVMGGGLDHGDVTWFAGGKLNVCYNAVDRHVESGRGDEVAMVWEVSSFSFCVCYVIVSFIHFT